MIALIDSDTPLFSAALSAQDKEDWVARSRLDSTIENILKAVDCKDFKLFVSGTSNFRKQIDPMYKANRKQEDPEHREMLRKYLIDSCGAIEAEGCEADDLCGVYQTEETIICGIDKDLLQIPGRHYQWPIIRGGAIIREGKFIDITEEQGFRNFFSQAIVGDTSDNIKGIHRMGPRAAETLLGELKSEEEMYNAVKMVYNDTEAIKDTALNYEGAIKRSTERLHNNLDLLWIWREMGTTYSIRREIM